MKRYRMRRAYYLGNGTIKIVLADRAGYVLRNFNELRRRGRGVLAKLRDERFFRRVRVVKAR